MPIYAYRCECCDHECEVLQKSSDAAPVCPACGEEFMSKQVTAAAFALKGDGWYQSDFANKKCPVAQAAESSGSAPPCAAGGCCANAPD